MKIRAFYAAPLLACCLTLPVVAFAQAAGGAVLGVTATVAAEVANGWSVKKSILGKDVYNDEAKPAVVGKVDDIIVNPQGSVSYAIVNASKYLGMSSHDVMIPVEQFKIDDRRITLPGATKDALRQLPEFKYAPNAGKALK
mgnify:CR=1 FL=1|jgi:sporulation protein YlmC with PRC-barrel domain